MFWPFGLNSFNQSQNSNNAHNFFPCLFPQNLASTQFINTYPSSFYELFQNYFTSFSQNDDLRSNHFNFTMQAHMEIQPEAEKLLI